MIKLKDNEFNDLVYYVKSNYGVNLSQKRMLIEGRMQSVLTGKNFNSFSQYYECLSQDKSGQVVEQLINKLTTNYTFFMREADHFEFLKKEVLPYLESNRKSEKDFRIWSAGCSSGEEPYTLAMVIDDYFKGIKGNRDTKILATDISTNVLDKAKLGIYENEQLNGLNKEYMNKYFKKTEDSKSQVVERVKNEVIFRKFNLMQETFPFKKKFHVIFCRNVMIYFDLETKTRLINRFYDSLEYGGYLFIGHSESINYRDYNLKYIIPSVYRK
jgi:chemotaxis protein methyltransferase CheR